MAPQATFDEALRAGVVVGNELDGRRACMLAHHILRVRSPCALLVHHDALALPAVGLFDRVLCDVPCSSDGTIRKAPQLWHSWRPNRGNVVHAVQLRIACAGATRLAEGGLMVYSTCSLNPVEDEAVVAALLQRAEGGLELVDCQGLPELPRASGLGSWSVLAGSRNNPNPAVLQSPADARQHHLLLSESLWPPKQDGLHLERCWRLFPHTGNSGGFFVALLRRTAKALPENFEVCDTPDADAEDLPEDAVCKDALPASQHQEPFLPAASSEHRPRIEKVLEFFGLECVPVENLFLRGNDIRNVYLVSDGVRDILLSSSDLQPVIAGVRIFEENRYLKTCDCELRLAQAGVQLLASSMRRRCEASYDDLLTLLKGEVVKFTDFPQGSLLRSSLEAVESQGSVAVVGEFRGARLCVAAERGEKMVRAFVKQEEKTELLAALDEIVRASPSR